MKLSLSIALSSVVGVAQAVLGPGYEDYMYCPDGDCEIYINPFGYMGPASMYNKCFNTTTGEFVNGVWTGNLTNVTAPEGWTQPPKCTAEEYSQCDTAEQCTLAVGPGCSCYVSSTVFPFDISNYRDASCTGNECDGYKAVCSAGENGEGNTCMIQFDLDLGDTNGTTATGATQPASGGIFGGGVTTVATTAAAGGGTGNTDGGETITGTTATTAGGSGDGAAPTPASSPSSGNVASVSISLFAVSAAIFGYFS